MEMEPLKTDSHYTNGKEKVQIDKSVTALEFDCSGSKIAIGYANGIVLVFRISGKSKEPSVILRLGKRVENISFAKESSSVIYVSHGDCVHAFDFLQSGNRIGFWKIPNDEKIVSLFANMCTLQSKIVKLEEKCDVIDHLDLPGLKSALISNEQVTCCFDDKISIHKSSIISNYQLEINSKLTSNLNAISSTQFLISDSSHNFYLFELTES